MSTRSQDDQSSTDKPMADIAGGRRKLLKLGVGATPVLMALASRSAFACHSTTPSAFGSVCNSRPELLQSSNGRSPGYWKTHTGTSNWPKPYYSHSIRTGRTTTPATTFKSVFCASGAPSPFSNETTLLDVLESGGGGSKAVARACVAALLNARSGRTPNSILSADDIVSNIWYQYATRSFYEPIAGIKWYSDTPQLPYIPGSNTDGKGGIIGYLNTTWT
jgi:hypothetical protein